MPGYIIETDKGFVALDGKGWLKLSPLKDDADMFETREQANLVARGITEASDWRILEVEVAFP